MLLSFERPVPVGRPSCRSGRPSAFSAALENCTVATATTIDKPWWQNGYHQPNQQVRSDHRQDSKGTWWMPWHLESMKGVDDCDKPR